ncbi:Reverse transcriptase (RNA-dependent DNA polymerase) [Fragilaria crotonensis]|nr:Reverse transcriptase (RNA-dependent DNA polymerase) [Fragilaria crotonensis]
MACDIQNAYLTADCREKIWTVAGPEFGSEAGTIFIVRKALYGLKSAELQTSPELKSDGIQLYRELIGISRWAVELGRVDVLLEVALMLTHKAMPREGHLQQLYRIFGYFKVYPRKRKIAFNFHQPKISERMFKQYDWCDFYRDATEAIPTDMPKPRGNNPMSKHCFVDNSHGSDRATRRSQTGILLFCNKAPIIWHTKRQNTVEASTSAASSMR